MKYVWSLDIYQLLSRTLAMLISLDCLQNHTSYLNFYFFANVILETYLNVLQSWVVNGAELLLCNKCLNHLYFLFCELFIPVLWVALSDVCVRTTSASSRCPGCREPGFLSTELRKALLRKWVVRKSLSEAGKNVVPTKGC